MEKKEKRRKGKRKGNTDKKKKLDKGENMVGKKWKKKIEKEREKDSDAPIAISAEK